MVSVAESVRQYTNSIPGYLDGPLAIEASTQGTWCVSTEKLPHLIGDHTHCQAHNLYKSHSCERYHIVPFGLDNAHMPEKPGRDGDTSLAILSSMPCIRSKCIDPAVLSQTLDYNGTRFHGRHYWRTQILSILFLVEGTWGDVELMIASASNCANCKWLAVQYRGQTNTW